MSVSFNSQLVIEAVRGSGTPRALHDRLMDIDGKFGGVLGTHLSSDLNFSAELALATAIWKNFDFVLHRYQRFRQGWRDVDSDHFGLVVAIEFDPKGHPLFHVRNMWPRIPKGFEGFGCIYKNFTPARVQRESRRLLAERQHFQQSRRLDKTITVPQGASW